MSRKLHKFQTVAEYQAYSASTAYTTPCVAVVEENNVIYYDYGNNKPQAPDLSDYKGEFQESSVGGDYYGKDAITKINYIPSSITSLDSAFENYASLQEVTCEIPSGVTGMGMTFYCCSSLINAPVIPSGVADMFYTFNGCSSLVNAPVMPDSVTEISYTFKDCISLINVPNISSSITDMMFTFDGCLSLVTAPAIQNSVTDMFRTFRNCSSLKELTMLGTTPPSMQSALQGCSSIESIYVPDSAVDAYKTATNWSEFADKIKPLSSKPSE